MSSIGLRQRKTHGYLTPVELSGNTYVWGYADDVADASTPVSHDRLVLLECELSDFNNGGNDDNDDNNDDDKNVNAIPFDARTAKTRPLANHEILSRKPSEWPLSLLFEVYEKTMKASMLTREEFAFWEEKDPEIRKVIVSILDKKACVLIALHSRLVKRMSDAAIFLKRMERDDRVFMAMVIWSAELLIEGDSDPNNLCTWFDVAVRLQREPNLEMTTMQNTTLKGSDKPFAVEFVSMNRYAQVCLEWKLSETPQVMIEHLLTHYGPKNPKVAGAVSETILASFDKEKTTIGTLFQNYSPSLFRRLLSLEIEEGTLVGKIVGVMKASDDVAGTNWDLTHLEFFMRVAELYTDEPPDEWSFKAAGKILFHALQNCEETTNDEFRRFHLAFRKSITLTEIIGKKTICDAALKDNRISFLKHIVQFCEADFGSSEEICSAVKTPEAFDILYVNRSWFREAVDMNLIKRILYNVSRSGTSEELHLFVLYFYRNNKVFQSNLETRIGSTSIFCRESMRISHYSETDYEKITWGQYCKAILKLKSKSTKTKTCSIQ
jgi:hypothetical protein